MIITVYIYTFLIIEFKFHYYISILSVLICLNLFLFIFLILACSVVQSTVNGSPCRTISTHVVEPFAIWDEDLQACVSVKRKFAAATSINLINTVIHSGAHISGVFILHMQRSSPAFLRASLTSLSNESRLCNSTVMTQTRFSAHGGPCENHTDVICRRVSRLN